MKKVLVVEDNPNNLTLMAYVLEKNSYEPILALTGEEGIELAKSVQPDIILLDIQLPGMDGIEAGRKMRDMESLAQTPIIAITSYAMAGDRERILNAGFTGYFEKPINPLTIMEKIEAVIETIES